MSRHHEPPPPDGERYDMLSPMSGDRGLRERTAEEVLRLTGGDPFADVLDAAERHRLTHGDACGLYPAGPLVMRLAATLARAAGAKTILDLGTGFGYSALWLASVAAPGAKVIGIDRFPEHVQAATRMAEDHRLADRCSFVAGDVGAVLSSFEAPVDFIHDDAWFAAEPPHLEAAVALLRVGGTLTMPNWFLLEDAVTGSPRRDWSAFAGSDWARDVRAFAHRLGNDERLLVKLSVTPPLGIAVRVA